MNRKETGQGPKLKKHHPDPQEWFLAIRNMNGATTIFWQYSQLNMSIGLNNNLEDIGAKQIDYFNPPHPDIFICMHQSPSADRAGGNMQMQR